MSVKIFCVSRDEYDLIEDFILYYGAIFGYENIVIIDNNSTRQDVLDIYQKYSAKGVCFEVAPSYVNDGQGDAFTSVMLKYKDTCEFLVGLDSDEFMCAKVEDGAGYIASKDAILQVFESIPSDVSKCVVENVWNSLVDPRSSGYMDGKMNRPVREQTCFCTPPEPIRKVFYRASQFKSTMNGNHDGFVFEGKELHLDSLHYFHFHNTGRKRMYERALMVIDGYKYFDVSLPLRDQVSWMCKYTSESFHGYGYHRIHQYARDVLRILDVWTAKSLPFADTTIECPLSEVYRRLKAHLKDGAYSRKRSLDEAKKIALVDKVPNIDNDDPALIRFDGISKLLSLSLSADGPMDSVRHMEPMRESGIPQSSPVDGL